MPAAVRQHPTCSALAPNLGPHSTPVFPPSRRVQYRTEQLDIMQHPYIQTLKATDPGEQWIAGTGALGMCSFGGVPNAVLAGGWSMQTALAARAAPAVPAAPLCVAGWRAGWTDRGLGNQVPRLAPGADEWDNLPNLQELRRSYIEDFLTQPNITQVPFTAGLPSLH